MVIVARGGGSLADLFAFCDETLCRTVALLRVPVIASVGHHTDRTLIDEVAAVSCSTPTHAAEAAVPVDCAAARGRAARARRAPRAPRPPGDPRARAHARAPLPRAGRPRRAPPRPPAPAAARAARRGEPRRGRPPAAASRTRAQALERRGRRGAVHGTERLGRPRGGRRGARSSAPPAPRGARRAADLERLRLALAAHDPAAHAGARLRARGGRGRRAGHQRRRGARPSAPPPPSWRTAGGRRPESVPRTPVRRRRDRRARVRPRRRLPCRLPCPTPRSPTRPPAPASRPSSAGSTPASPACARRSSCARRAAGSWSSARRSWRPSATGLEELRLDELVARLETRRAAA